VKQSAQDYAATTGRWPTAVGAIESRRYKVPLSQIEAN
jgi:hypothetical protein